MDAGFFANCFPNPTNGALTMEYALSSDMDVAIRILNATSSEVRTMPQGSQSAGKHSLAMETAALPAGMYGMKFELGADVLFRKVVVLV